MGYLVATTQLGALTTINYFTAEHVLHLTEGGPRAYWEGMLTSPYAALSGHLRCCEKLRFV